MKKFFLIWLFACSMLAAKAQDINSSSLWQGKERELRYKPDGEEFVIENGDKRFTRAIYGTHTGFRFETSDFPEFGLYMPMFGGSVYMAVSTPSATVWINELASIESRFKSGQRTYIVKDEKLLGNGTLRIDALALADGDGFIVKYEADGVPAGTKIGWIYGGASHKRFDHDGELGFATDDFIFTADDCEGNIYRIDENRFSVYYGYTGSGFSAENLPEKAVSLSGLFPAGTNIRQVDGGQINSLHHLLASEKSVRPVIFAEYEMTSDPFYFELHNPASRPEFAYANLEKAFGDGVEFRTRIAARLKINTPDPYLNTLGGVFSGAEDGAWENAYLHGAVAWRYPLPGWRAAYLADLLGLQDRARKHFNGYLNAQVTNVPVTLPPTQDKELNLARAAKVWGTPMYSNGYICRTPNRTNVMHHYDMAMVFIDELLWHLNWTGDMEYAREIFPALQRHLAWEKNTYDPDNDGLYDAYCCIWASDALQYNGGKVTHSTAYNYRANRMVAEIAGKLGEDPTPYEKEAERILSALNRELWIADKGWWAEFVDNMGRGMRHDNAALWTIYHSIDSEVHDPFQAYQATRYVDTEIPHIPVLAKGLDDTTTYVVSTTNWQPYAWSINNVAFGEIAHTALAYWQTGRNDEAYRMFKGNIYDAMYLGSGPGNVTQTSFYDAALGEKYRDFSDATGIGVRALVQGLYGIVPDLMNDRLVIRPGFPDEWDFAEIETANMAYSFKREGNTDRYTVRPNLLKKNVQLILEVNAPTNRIGSIQVNGKPIAYSLVGEAVGMPKIRIDAGKAPSYDITIEWAGEKIAPENVSTVIANGGDVKMNLPFQTVDIHDPQGILSEGNLKNGILSGVVSAPEGHRTLFVRVVSGDMKYWLPIDIQVVQPVDIVHDAESRSLDFTLVNNSDKSLSGRLYVNGKDTGKKINIAAGRESGYTVSSPDATLGTNRVEIRSGRQILYAVDIVNWNIANPSGAVYRAVDIERDFNDWVRDIFQYGKYLSPRWEYTTLQVPTQGMGEWCRTDWMARIDDSGLRGIAAQNDNVFKMPQGIPFSTPGASNDKNVIFTTLWDNYPTEVTVPLNGKASKAYFLVAASTYHMQSHILNGQIRVKYTDGSEDILDLVLPDNLLPLYQDVFIDGWAFDSPQPRPWRVELKTGEVSTYHSAKLAVEISNEKTWIDGGMATMIDMPLNSDKELDSLTLETLANEVVIGLMGITLMR